VDVPQGGECEVTFKVKNTGTLDVTIDYVVEILDAKGTVVGVTGPHTGPTIPKNDEKPVTSPRIGIDATAAIGLGSVRVTIYKHDTNEVLDQETCNIVNIVSGIAAEITSIEVTKV